MSILTNPVTVSVIVLCVLSLLKLNVLLAMLVACIAGGLAGGIPIYAERGKGGGIRLTEQFVLNKSVLSAEERRSLLAALRGMEAVGPGGAPRRRAPTC